MTDGKFEKTADEKLAEDVERDFLTRQQERRLIERSWQLNLNFVCGRQYCDVNSSGDLYEEDRQYYWQTRRVFNHIAPIVDTRVSKLGRIRPALSVRAASDEEKDKHAATLASAILTTAFEDGDMDAVITDATIWSETCGTAFYKIIWDGGAGGEVGVRGEGEKLCSGDVKVAAVSPFEIYPAVLSEEKLSAQPSIIHAKALPVQDIYSMYGVKLAGRDIEEFSLSPYSAAVQSRKTGGDIKAVRHGYELVIERYEKPTEDMPEGRLTVVAGGQLLYDGSLPYLNGDFGGRDYPFIKQVALPQAGSFFGSCVVERLIPVQRAYNAVKNRKHEFLNRISMGTVAVEDGSVDVDEFVEDGLTPGKVVVYRQGSKPPEMLQFGAIPSCFGEEEQSLLKEFTKISGTGDISETADNYAGVTSATGLQLIIDQDEVRLDCSYGQIKRAIKRIGRQILRLYRQFASDMRLLKFVGENNVLSLYYFKGSDISSDDVVLEADSDSNLSPAQRRAALYEVLDRGLLDGEDGKLGRADKNRVLEILGYKSLAGEKDLGALNRARAGDENLKMRTAQAEVKDYDDHATHITEHTAFLLTEKLTPEVEARICAHIDMHKNKIKEQNND